MDAITKAKRSEIMSKIRAKNTKPEIAVRKILHNLGFRFSLHRKDLPGKPDICLRKYETLIFVHGCFWHNHQNCPNARFPKSNTSYWVPKIIKNSARDEAHKKNLKKLGWKTITVWECHLKKPEKLRTRLQRILIKR